MRSKNTNEEGWYWESKKNVENERNVKCVSIFSSLYLLTLYLGKKTFTFLPSSDGVETFVCQEHASFDNFFIIRPSGVLLWWRRQLPYKLYRQPGSNSQQRCFHRILLLLHSHRLMDAGVDLESTHTLFQAYILYRLVTCSTEGHLSCMSISTTVSHKQ